MSNPYYKCTQCEHEITGKLPNICPGCGADNMGWIETFKSPDGRPVEIEWFSSARREQPTHGRTEL